MYFPEKILLCNGMEIMNKWILKEERRRAKVRNINDRRFIKYEITAKMPQKYQVFVK